VGLEAFSGTATISGDLHGAVRLSDRKFIRLPNGTPKRVVALGRLEPRLPGPPGDRTNVALIADADDQASILLRADITLTTDAGVVVPPPAQPVGAAPPGPAIGLPHGEAATEGEDVGNDAIPPD
jgi:hypothetical protein